MTKKCLIALGVACLLIAGCGGGNGDSSANAPASAPVSSAPSPAGADGAATAQVPIVAAPTEGCNVADGADASPSPVLNSKLDCAP